MKKMNILLTQKKEKIIKRLCKMCKIECLLKVNKYINITV